MTTKSDTGPPKRGRDVTRTARQEAHLERLEVAQGKRLVVDLDAGARQALENLLQAGYGTSQAAVVRRALVEAVQHAAPDKD